ncbi:MAG: helix-turn-helix domain-containing protein [Oscillospiraceae bacterium]|jgi:transcriptional regulator with XRE-family HTH domain|nr:helix-turn-helix domain-containing protein [Oscillospiraceae bacterium]
MNSDFPRILTLLRKEKGISQKSAAADLEISQALLSHYEKGIRECGLDFLARCADYYQVSCDYLLGRSPDRHGATLTVEDIPEPDAANRDNRMISRSVLPVLNKKLIANSQGVLFDLLARADNKALTGEVSAYLMLAVYRMYRLVYGACPKNQEAMFSLPAAVARGYADAAMQICEANTASITTGTPLPGFEALKRTDSLNMTTEQIGEEYPMWASSLFNLIQGAEKRLEFRDKSKP